MTHVNANFESAYQLKITTNVVAQKNCLFTYIWIRKGKGRMNNHEAAFSYAEIFDTVGYDSQSNEGSKTE